MILEFGQNEEKWSIVEKSISSSLCSVLDLLRLKVGEELFLV